MSSNIETADELATRILDQLTSLRHLYVHGTTAERACNDAIAVTIQTWRAYLTELKTQEPA